MAMLEALTARREQLQAQARQDIESLQVEGY